MAVTDSSCLRALGIKGSMHLIATDLPYGVQHAPGGQKGKSLEQMVRDVLPAWKEALVPGGAMALAFNVNTLKLDFVREEMAKVGLKVMTGAGYDGLEHWVEQAISRDVAVAVKA
jgi:tRNA G10  N-methylase Trm11